MYVFTLSSTSALDWGGWSTPRRAILLPGTDLVPTGQESRLGGPRGRYGQMREISSSLDSIPGWSCP